MKLLFLGAAYFQTPPIQYSLISGHQVYTLDNRPNNPGHGIAHRSFNISTIDIDRVWETVSREKIDAVFSYGSDISAPTAAFCNHKLGLISKSQEQSIFLLTNKFDFREFLSKKGLQNIFFKKIDCQGNIVTPSNENLPLIIKPCFNSGSKGVSKVERLSEINEALNNAKKFSLNNEIIIESFVSKIGCQICGDGYIEDGKIIYFGAGDGHFYEGGLTPYAESFPSSHEQGLQNETMRLAELVLNEAGYIDGPFNVDAIIQKNNLPFIFEIGPRNGGNFIPQAIEMHSNINLTRMTIDGMLGQKFSQLINPKINKKYIASYMLHTPVEGYFKSLKIDSDLIPHIKYKRVNVNSGELVNNFHITGSTYGNLLMEFPDFGTMQKIMSSINKLCRMELL